MKNENIIHHFVNISAKVFEDCCIASKKQKILVKRKGPIFSVQN